MMKSKFKKRVLVITHNYPLTSGNRQNAGVFVYDFVNMLAKYAQVVVFCPGAKDKTVELDGVNIRYFGWNSKLPLGQLKLWNPNHVYLLVIYFISGFKELDVLLKKEGRMDFVLSMWAFPSGIFSLYLYFRKMQYGVWCLGSDIYIYAKKPILGFLIRKILDKARLLLADSPDLCREVKEISGRECDFVPSASLFPIVKPKTNISSDRIIRLGFVGRLEAVKGVDILIDSLVKIKPFLVNYRVEILGDGFLYEALKKRSEEEGLCPYIKFHGNVSEAYEIAKVLSSVDWVVIPSRSDSIPIVFSETMKSGTPVIVSDLEDLKYLVNKYDVGLVFKAGSSLELSKILLNLSNMKEARERFRKNTREVAKLFDIDYIAKEFSERVNVL